MKQRLTPARDIGRYKGYGDEAWNDEVLVGAPESDFQWQVERLLEDAEQPGAEDEAQEGTTATHNTSGGAEKKSEEQVERPMPRATEADIKQDVRSLNRMLQRTLYLLVKDKQGEWAFPHAHMESETLHQVWLV